MRTYERVCEVSGLGAMPMEIDSDPSNSDRTSAQCLNSSSKNQTALNRGTVSDDIPQDIPEIKTMSDVVHDDHVYKSVSLWQDHGNDVIKPDKILEEQIMRDKETASPVVEEILSPGGHSIPSQLRQEPPSTTSVEAHEIADPQISFGHQSPDLALLSTPLEEPKTRRKRKLLIYDKDIVLPNHEMKKRLQGTGIKLREKKKGPCSSLDIWKQSQRLRKDGIFFEPLITGGCLTVIIL